MLGNPRVPQVVGRWARASLGCIYGVAASDDYAYVADGGYGLHVIDVRDPSNPRRTGGARVSGQALRVVVRDHLAYVAGGGAGLQIIDVSNPSAPNTVGQRTLLGWSSGLALVGNFAYVADELSGLTVVNVSNPTAPKSSARISTSAPQVRCVQFFRASSTVFSVPGRLRKEWASRFPGITFMSELCKLAW